MQNLLNGEYSCTCVLGYYGDDCEADVDYCLSNPCHQESTCVVSTLNNKGIKSLKSFFFSPQDELTEYSCICSVGFTGKNCDQEFDYCASLSPCIYGTCTNVS